MNLPGGTNSPYLSKCYARLLQHVCEFSVINPSQTANFSQLSWYQEGGALHIGRRTIRYPFDYTLKYSL